MTRIAAFVPDVMDRSKVAAAGGSDVTFVRAAAHLVTAGADLVVVDLARPGVLEALRQLGDTPSIGFASHVDRELIEAARAAGCGRVLARSQFFGSLPGLLA